MTGIRPIVSLIAIIAFAGSAFAAGDPKEGHRLAQLWCANCHVVDADQTTASADVPAFQTIANSAALTSDNLAAFLADPHPVMPSMDLSRTEIADLVAYIESLKTN